MANTQLIKGAAQVYGSQSGGYQQQDVLQKGISSGLSTANQILTAQQNKRAKANEYYQSQVNSYMSQFKTDMDFTGFNAKETGTMRDFLMGQRNKYTQAAKMAAKYSDTTDPNYLMYVDQMQAVNNSFQNLAKQLSAYKQNKLGYAENQMNSEVSLGTDPRTTRQNSIVYGFEDLDGDGVNDVNPNDAMYQSFFIGDGGNLKFMVDGEPILYNDLKPVDYKDYELANYVLNGNESVFNSGQKMNQIEKDQYVLNLQQKLSNPKALQSLVFDFGASGIRLEGIAEEWSNDPQPNFDYYRNKVIEQLLIAREAVANEGAKQKKQRSNSSSSLPKAVQTFNAQFASLTDEAWAANPNGYAMSQPGGGKVVFNYRDMTDGANAGKRVLTIRRGDGQEVIITPGDAKAQFGIEYEIIDSPSDDTEFAE